MAKIIIEGPDGSGKSYTACSIERAVPLSIYPTQGPPKSAGEIVRRVIKFFGQDNLIFDRCPLISEMVYGPVIRGNHIFDKSWLIRFDPQKDIIVYCRPSTDTIIETKLVQKDHKPQDHVEEVIKKHHRIIERYDVIMSYIDGVIEFNRDNQTLEELCAELILRLPQLKQE